jgi:phosphoribosylglycinamide formyltransferase-1
VKRIVVLISGRGSNLQALLAAPLPGRIAAVVSNEPSARGLDLARSASVPTALVPHREFPDRPAFDRALADAVDRHAPDLVVLAGFMRILTGWFAERYAGRLINIHPSLLPAFQGTHTHRRALEEGVRVHGATVHFVTPTLDHGPIIVQAAVPVLQSDNEERLAARVLEQEHRILPQAVRWFLDGRLRVDGNRVLVDGLNGTGVALICPDVVSTARQET